MLLLTETHTKNSEVEQPKNEISVNLRLGSDESKEIEYRSLWFDAANKRNINGIRNLLLLGANVDWKDDESRTALHICAGCGHKKLVSLLLDYDAIVDAKDENSSTALHLAAWHGKSDILSLLLDHGADIEAKDDHSQTALHMAVSRGISKSVQMLLNRGAFVESKDYESSTPLHVAACGGNKEVVRLLLKHGASFEAKDDESLTTLHLAAVKGNKEVVRLLLNYGARVDAKNRYSYTALHLAAMEGNKEVVQLLLNHGATVDAKNRYSYTALHVASMNGHKEIVYLLINQGACVDAKDRYLYTALHHAAKEGHKEVVQLLLNLGASLDTNDITLCSPLHMAVRYGHIEVVRLLLSRGAAVDTKDKYLATTLHRAAWVGHKEIVRLILNHGATIDAKDENLDTPLHLAAKNGDTEVAQLLLDHGAAVDAKNRSSCTALYRAAIKGYIEVASQLLSRYTDIDQKLKDGKTLLTELSKIGDIPMVTLLLEHGFDIEGRNINGQTPLIIAAKAAQLDMVSLLIEKGANLEATDTDLLTALHWAAKEGNSTVLDLLLQNDARIDATTKHGDTPLHLAAGSNHSKIVSTLIKCGSYMNAENEGQATPCQIAIENGHIDIVLQLLSAGVTTGNSEDKILWLLYQAADAGRVVLVKRAIDMISIVDERIYYMNATLLRASQHGKFDVISYLLDRGADIETYAEDGLRPLFLSGQYPELTSMLIHRGAYLEARNEANKNQTVLHYFASLGHIESLQIVVNCGFNIDLTDDDDNTALHHIANKGDCDVATLLLIQGVDINAKNVNGETALHIATENGFFDLAALLIEKGIDIEAKSFDWESTALHTAVTRRNSKLIALLLNEHADPNAKDAFGHTALHLAVLYGLEKESDLIIEHGANVNAMNVPGRPPLFYAVTLCNPDLVNLLIERGASVHTFHFSYDFLKQAIDNASSQQSYSHDRKFTAVVTSLIDAGCDITGIQVTDDMAKRFPTLLDTLTKTSNQYSNKDKITLDVASTIVNEDVKEVHQSDVVLYELKTNVNDEHKVNGCLERRLNHIKHKYGYGFPASKELQLDDYPDIDENDGLVTSAQRVIFTQSLKIDDDMPIDERAITIIQSLLNCVGAKLFGSAQFFMLEMDRYVDEIPSKWALEFDKMKGTIREHGRFIVQIPSKNTTFSVPMWHNSTHPYLRFIDAVYVCRRSSIDHAQEAFSDVLGGSESKLAIELHGILIAGLSILSVAGGDGLVEKLVMCVLGVKLDGFHGATPQDPIPVDWQIRNRRQCPCNTSSIHRPLSPVAAAKAVGISIWREPREQIVNRVWDLQEDKLTNDIDARKVVFVTHRWSSPEVRYEDIMKMANLNDYAISGMSEKLYRIRKTLLAHTQYVWVDAICIDKSNLSELDEAIRSMYKWYASCSAVILDSDTSLGVWRKRGWCLQEGAAAGVLCGISKEGTVVTIQKLAIQQNQDLCTLDLHLYYQPGNAAEILTRMNVRETSREEDMAYALAGIFSINLTLAYGEGLESRERLLHQLATKKGDLSFLAFQTTQATLPNYLPTISEANYLIAICRKASTSITVCHFGILFEVQLIKRPDIRQILQKLNRWKNLKFAKGRFIGVKELVKAAERLENQSSSTTQLAIVHDIRSLMVVRTYDEDRQAGGRRPIKICYRLQCCQIEENEFKRLFGEIDIEFERIWLGEKPDRVITTKSKSRQVATSWNKRK